MWHAACGKLLLYAAFRMPFKGIFLNFAVQITNTCTYFYIYKKYFYFFATKQVVAAIAVVVVAMVVVFVVIHYLGSGCA